MGRGILHLSHSLLYTLEQNKLIKPPSFGEISFGMTDDILRFCQDILKIVHLPDMFEPVALFYDTQRLLFCLHLTAECIPTVDSGEALPTLEIVLQRDTVGKTRIAEIRSFHTHSEIIWKS